MLPTSFAGLSKADQLDLSHNVLTGVVPKKLCELPSLDNFTFSYNYFTARTTVACRRRGRTSCLKAVAIASRRRPGKGPQRDAYRWRAARWIVAERNVGHLRVRIRQTQHNSNNWVGTDKANGASCDRRYRNIEPSPEYPAGCSWSFLCTQQL
ncbi:hypothetical protein OPV22_014981 [Ensete ventricosum]|uniref:Leucine-rich repeat-containing N-terminal plant-type domain-containing protein n=1 Tax=Ensete ventricosum TaxID=4639 RepID=A0AAV8R2T0_ENSVE|nr:hypothetical protein OPV22_014981 [Ensete ventricosum]